LFFTSLSSKELEMEEIKKTIEKNTDRKYELQAEISKKQANIENLEKRKSQLNQEIFNFCCNFIFLFFYFFKFFQNIISV